MYHIMTIKFLEIFFGKSDIRSNNLRNKCVEYLLPLIFNMVVSSGIGHTFEIESEMIIFSMFYTVLKTSNGGYYYKFNVKNTIFLWSSAVVILKSIPYILLLSYGKVLLFTFLIGSLIIVFCFLPIVIQQSESPKNMRKVILKTSYKIILLESIPLIYGIFFYQNKFIVAAIVGIMIQSISLILVQERDKQVISLHNDNSRKVWDM